MVDGALILNTDYIKRIDIGRREQRSQRVLHRARYGFERRPEVAKKKPKPNEKDPDHSSEGASRNLADRLRQM